MRRTSPVVAFTRRTAIPVPFGIGLWLEFGGHSRDRHLPWCPRLDAVPQRRHHPSRWQHRLRLGAVARRASVAVRPRHRAALLRRVDRHGDETFDGTCLLSHLHWDHVQGLPFFKPLLRPGSRLAIHAPTQFDGRHPGEVLLSTIRPPLFPISLDEFNGDVIVYCAKPQFNVGSYIVHSGVVPHNGAMAGYRVEHGATPSPTSATTSNLTIQVSRRVRARTVPRRRPVDPRRPVHAERVRAEAHVGPLHGASTPYGWRSPPRRQAPGAVPPRPVPRRRHDRADDAAAQQCAAAHGVEVFAATEGLPSISPRPEALLAASPPRTSLARPRRRLCSRPVAKVAQGRRWVARPPPRRRRSLAARCPGSRWCIGAVIVSGFVVAVADGRRDRTGHRVHGVDRRATGPRASIRRVRASGRCPPRRCRGGTSSATARCCCWASSRSASDAAFLGHAGRWWPLGHCVQPRRRRWRCGRSRPR